MVQIEQSQARQVALMALLKIEQGQFADAALQQGLAKANLKAVDRRFITELVYGVTRRRRTLDALIDQYSSKEGDRQPLKLRLILRLGLYQMRYLTQVPASAAVNTSVELAKQNGLKGLSGFVNGLLRRYGRESAAESSTSEPHDPLNLPEEAIARLAILHSYPDWILQVWSEQLPLSELDILCQYFNQPPSINLRVNRLQTTRDQVLQAFEDQGIEADVIPFTTHGIQLRHHAGDIRALPGYDDGWWSVQDASAQGVVKLLAPKPGEIVIDACAAPGGKTTQIAECMGDRGQVWACDRQAKRLRRVEENQQRLKLNSIQTKAVDMRSPDLDDLPLADRVLVDAPCSGLGTLNRHADARWQQTPESVADQAIIQTGLLNRTSQLVKPGGVLVYATCTLHPAENEQQIQQFLKTHPNWRVEPPAADSPLDVWTQPEGWLKIWPHQHQMDGFFMARLRHQM
ncbi:MAG: 16S rRNA (cytosine(967)-C(5))-methyltransferase [Elainellaceae cyanobacterium]